MPSRKSQVINSQLKKLKPPTVYTCNLVDCANLKTYFKLFNDCKQVEDDVHVEQLTHLIVLATRLHNAATEGALMPLMKKLSTGGDIAQNMTQNMKRLEETAAKIDATKKHLDNKEFVQLMEQLESFFGEAVTVEQQALVQLVNEVDEETLMQAADLAEQAKDAASLVPRA